ncbi:hypothetical protein HHK36_031954 [Tetracentron sinense]|uniref:Uncharacterized protein n=1 Tax=Tetracentron sinense TaxID=13715 RepID=A0A834Y691_TETSI|nr:hypothetical protein HHK36_031954 [Tetracentron sinense]
MLLAYKSCFLHFLFVMFGYLHHIRGSPDRESVGSGTKRSSVSSGSRPRNRKEFLRKFVNSEILTAKLEDWFEEILEKSARVSFQQLIRMPNAVYASTSDAVEATAYLAIEDFLHAGVKGLWEEFWSQGDPMPFSVACLHGASLKFYPAEKAIASGKLGSLCATAIMLKNTRHPHGKWDHILELALLRPDIGSTAMESNGQPSLSVLGEALFLLCEFYCQEASVEGDVNKLEFDVNNVYECAAEWIRKHTRISLSPIDRIWNKLGNANWGDIGALQVLLATFHCIVQFAGMPKQSVEDLSAAHGSRLQTRRTERQLRDTRVNGNGVFWFQQRSVSPEIVEVQDESIRVESEELMKLEAGSILWIEDSNWQKGFQINELLNNGELPFYIASSVEEPGKALFYMLALILPSWNQHGRT